jgi:hypothetical protein
MRIRKFIFVIISFHITVQIHAQESIFLPAQLSGQLNNELSGEIAVHTMRELAQIQQLNNSNSYFKAFKFLENSAREIGLFQIRLIEQPASRYEWEVRKAELWMLSPQTRKLANFHELNASLAVFSRTTHAMAELIDVGTGENDTDYAGKEVAQKIVLASGTLDIVMRKAVWEYGALGVLSYHEQNSRALNDKIFWEQWQAIPIGDGNGKTGTFAFIISAEAAKALLDILYSKSERTTFGRDKSANLATSILLRVDIDASVRDAGKSWHLTANVPGEEILSEDIVLTATLPDNAIPPFHDFSGAAGLLEIARTLTRLINDGVLPVPRRSIRFWWTSGSESLSPYFMRQPEAKDSMLVHLDLGQIGSANQNSGGYSVALAPLSNATFWNEVVASIAVFLRDVNSPVHINSRRTLSRNDLLVFRNWPVLSRTGSSDPYEIELSGMALNPSQKFFAQSAIGIPSLAIIPKKMPDFTSQAQIFEQIDPTQLKRNIFLATAASWYLAGFKDENIAELVAAVYSKSQQRLALALEKAFQLVRQNESSGYGFAGLVIEETIKREVETMSSINYLATKAQALELIHDFSRTLRDDEKTAKNRLKLFYSSLYKRRPPKTNRLNAQAKLALRTVPRNNHDLVTYLNRRPDPDNQLPPFIVNEIFNFIDGQRSIYEIYRAVLAEAIVTGVWPHDMIALENVRNVIEKGVQRGMLVY